MVNDPEEKVNQINNPEYAGRIREMAARVKKYIEDGRSTPGAKAANDGGNSWKQITDIMSGLYAGNYDITHVFIDSLTKIVASEATDHAVEEFLDWLNSFSEKNNIKFTVTISADASLATDGVKKYF